MKQNDRMMRDFVTGGINVGLVAAIGGLRQAGWRIEDIAAQVPVIQKTVGNEAIRAAGLNGGPRVSNLYEHMETFGDGVCMRMQELRADDIASN